jgi:putative aldouronate transport system permease protein
MKRRPFTVFDGVNYVVFALLSFACFFPFYYIFINTISDPLEVTRGNVIFLPRGVHFQNYTNILRDPAIFQAVLVSVGRTVIGTVVTVFSSAYFGYLLTKKELPLRAPMYKFVVVTMFFHAGLIPWFLTMRLLGLGNNFLLYILPTAIVPFYLVLFKTYVEQSIPDSLQESALMDGAGHFVIFVRIVFPLATPIVATLAVFTSVGQWNMFQDTLFLIRDRRLYTLQMLLYQYMRQVEAIAGAIRQSGLRAATGTTYYITPTAVRMTISMVVVFPILIVYPVLQRYFVKGIMVGAIKG